MLRMRPRFTASADLDPGLSCHRPLQASSCWLLHPTWLTWQAALCSTPCGRSAFSLLQQHSTQLLMFCFCLDPEQAAKACMMAPVLSAQPHMLPRFVSLVLLQGTVVRKAWVRPNFKAGGSVRRMQLAPGSGGRAGGGCWVDSMLLAATAFETGFLKQLAPGSGGRAGGRGHSRG